MMRAHAWKAGLAAALVTFTIGTAFAAPIDSLVEHEALLVHGISPVEIPGKVPHYAPMERLMVQQYPGRHMAKYSVLQHEVWLNDY